MAPNFDEFDSVDLERRLIAVICQKSCPMPLRQKAEDALRGYFWKEPIHQIIFECVMRQPDAAAISLREQLPALLARKGFPDVEWGAFFRPCSVSEKEMAELLHQLIANQKAGASPGPI